MAKRPTAEWLVAFRDDLLDAGFREDFIEQALLLALDTELRADGLVVAPEDFDG